MYARGLFDTPSEDDIQRIVQQIKARSKSSQAPRAGLSVDRAIDSLAAQYSSSLQSTCKAESVVAREDSDAFYGFVQFLKHISGSFRSFSKEATQICGPEQRIVGDMAWDALVYQILDERVSAWMEEWMYATLWCILHCMQRQPESIVQLHSLVPGRISAQLEQFHRGTG
ncbi:hypothetical protein GGF42_009146, partial [Coemansia sp. RSA 2424]